MKHMTVKTRELVMHPDQPAASLGSVVPQDTSIMIVRTRDFSVDLLQTFLATLDKAERVRADRFYARGDHDSYIIVHGLLRMVAGRFLGILPSQVRFEYNAFGKPFIKKELGTLFFSLSHSRDMSLLAFDTRSEIGADIEFMDKDFDFREITERFFTSPEQVYIAAVPGLEKERFYRLWTRKEALLKAVGTGISSNLGIEVSRNTNRIPSMRILKDGGHPGNFILSSCIYDTDYMITVASPGDPTDIRTQQISGPRHKLILN